MNMQASTSAQIIEVAKIIRILLSALVLYERIVMFLGIPFF